MAKGVVIMAKGDKGRAHGEKGSKTFPVMN